MIERYTITTTADQLKERFSIDTIPNSFKKCYNMAPSQLLPVITALDPKNLSFFYWGLEPHLSKNKTIATKFINAPIPLLLNKITYKNSLVSRRCIIPADGFYIWKPISKKRKIPYRVVLEDKSLFSMAGLWEKYSNIDEKEISTFTIITQEANSTLKKISPDMPVLLTKDKENKWLSNDLNLESSIRLLSEQLPVNLSSFPVSPMLNNIKNNTPELILPSPPADQLGNYTLFS